MTNKREIFDNLNVDKIDFIGYKNSDLLFDFENNNIETIGDIVDIIHHDIENRKCNALTMTLVGILSLCNYKYFNVFSSLIINLLNSEFKTKSFLNHSDKAIEDYSRFYMLGFTHSEMVSLYEYYKNINCDYTMINLLSHIKNFNASSLPKYLLNKCNLLIEYYDNYYKQIKGQMRI